MPCNDKAENGKPRLMDPVFGAASFLRSATSVMLRGGRVTKFKGIAASYAPELGLFGSGSSQAAVGGRGSSNLSLARRLLRWSAAPAALLVAQSPAFAQAQNACVEVTPDRFLCENNGDPATTEQDFSYGGDVVVSIEDGFEVDTSGLASGEVDGINVNGAASLLIEQVDGSSSISGRTRGIDAINIAGDTTIVTGGDVSGRFRTGIFVEGSGAISLDTTAGAVSGGSNGIEVSSRVSGILSVTTADVTGENGDGIEAENSGTDLTINTTAGIVTGAQDGIDAVNRGIGDLSITTGNVDGGSGNGIRATNQGAGTGGDLTIDTSAGAVSGDVSGIYATNNGTGDTTITTANVTGGFGIVAFSSGTNLAIDSSAGSVTGGSVGMRVQNGGSGAISITTADVTGNYGNAVYAVNAGPDSTDMTVDTSAGSVTSIGGAGIFVGNLGTGALTITTGDVSGLDGDAGLGQALAALSNGTDLTIDTSAGSVSGGVAAIVAANDGSGDTLITTADVTVIRTDSYGYAGISAFNGNGTGDLTIDSSAGSVIGSMAGISAVNNGRGAVSLTTANVSSRTGDGIIVKLGEYTGSGTDIIIDTAAGAVVGDANGVDARNEGTGATTITTADVTGTTGDGINVYGGANSTDIAIDTTAGAVTGGTYGIDVYSDGTGTTTVTTADVTGATGAGIDVFGRDNVTGITIDTTAGSVTGENDGINVFNRGTGDTLITTANITSSEIGVDFRNLSSGGDVTIDTSAGSIFTGAEAIRVVNEGRGALSITTADVDAVGSTDGMNVENRSGSDTTDLTIDTSAGTVNAFGSAIIARNYGSGALTISTADVNGGLGANASGIGGENSGTDFTIDSRLGSVSGSNFGINALNEGSGVLSITTANVTGASNDGIDAFSDGGNGIVIDTTAGVVSGGDDGINARNDGTGDVTITTADVTGAAGGGIDVFGGENSTGVAIDTTTGAVTGGDDGINARNDGTGPTTITTADVTGTDSSGIEALNAATAQNLTIDSSAGTVSAGEYGIVARNYGSGVLSITTADVTGEYGYGIAAVSSGTDMALDSSAGSVTGNSIGIILRNEGSGAISITAADVTGGSDIGIYAGNTAEGTDVTVDSSLGSVTGASDGIVALNNGTGDLSITTGDVTGQDVHGIRAISSGVDLTIDSTAGAVEGGLDGIDAFKAGSGVLSITTGNVTGNSNDGISALTFMGTDLSIDSSAGEVSGGNAGISARNGGSGNTSITTADVTGNTGNGISAYNNNGAGDLIIDSSAGSVSGGSLGIDGRNYGTGSMSVTTGDVIGTTSDGVEVSDFEDGGDTGGGDVNVNTSAGSVTGGSAGIRALNGATGSLTIITADVTGNDDGGILAFNYSDNLSINSSAGTVTGYGVGIYARNTGTGETSITAANVTAMAGDGVNVSSDAGTTTLDIDTSDGAVVGSDRGIYANHAGSEDLTITVSNVTGQSAEGILAATTQAGANILVQGGEGVDGNVIGATTGIALTAQGADITVTNLDSVTGQNGDGLNLVSNGGDIAVTDIGTVAGLGGNGIFASSDAGNISVQNVGLVGGITATGGIGIAAYADNGGTISIGTSGDIGTVSGSTYGVYGAAAGGTGDVTIDVSNYAITGAIGIRADNAGAGDTTVITADVTGTAGEGIFASTAGRDVLVNTVAGSVVGLTDGIITSNTGTGNTTITTANVTGTTADGINATSRGTDMTIYSTAGSVIGGANGIVALDNSELVSLGGDNPVITIITADVTGETADGINARGSDISIDSSAGSVMGGSNGIIVSNNVGDVAIITADVTGEGADGINLFNNDFGGAVSVDSTAGVVTGSQDGIDVANSSGSNATILTGDVIGGGNGIAAQNSGSKLTINSAAGRVAGGLDGINADHFGDGVLSIITAGVSGGQNGIYARSRGIDATINSAAGSVTGGVAGIDAQHDGTGTVTIIAADVTGNAGDGISAFNLAQGADLIINSAAGTVTGSVAGIDADNNGAGVLIITSAEALGGSGDGIAADNSAAGTDLLINSVAGGVSGGQNGIAASNLGTGGVIITTADVAGTADDGINAANSAAGDLTIDSSAGAVTGATTGIFADQRGAGATSMLVNEVTGAVGIDSNATTGTTVITLGSTAVVTGTTGFGIDAHSTGGDVTVQGFSGSVTGAADGIYVRPTIGDITIANIDLVEGLAGDGLDLLTQGGAINVSDVDAIVGSDGNGITANASGGAGGLVTLQSAGDITGSLSGIAATTDGAGTVTIDVAGQTTGMQNGIAVSTEGGAATINNSGVLSGGEFAVLASGANTGPITLDNSGMLASAIQFAAADDQLLNSGTFSAQGVSDFGDGDDTFVNFSTLTIATSAQFDRLEQLQSSGIIDLTNNQSGGTFVTSGDFIGDGGQVGLDVNFADGSGDIFVIGGAATGNTQLVINVLGGDFSFDGDVLIVDAGAGTEASAFSFADGAGSATAFLSFELGFDAAANDFFVSANLEERVFESTKTAEAAQSLWYRSADAWGDHRANSRVAGSQESPVWAVAYGVSAQRDEQFSDPTGLGLNDTNLDYQQDYFGMQGGVDYRIADSLTIGLTGGYLNSSFRQDASGNRVDFDVTNIGLSASLNADGFFADALIKYDSISGNLADPARSGFNGQVDGSALGARFETGYRIGNNSFYVEPRVSLDLQKTDLDNLDIEGQSFAFDNLDGVRGAAGLRFGGYGKTSGSTTIGYFLDASAVREFDGKADVRFQVSNEVVDFQNDPVGTYAHVEAGVTLDNKGPISGFFQIEGDLSQDYSSFGGKVGMKVKF